MHGSETCAGPALARSASEGSYLIDPSAPDQSTLSALPILYVDDEQDNLRLFRLHFSESFDVHTAGDAPEALALLAQHDFGVLLSDERMPGMSGVELLARAAQLCPDTVRIVVSAYADSARLLSALNRGHAYEYVVKPWCRNELAECLERALTMAQRRRLLLARAELGERLSELSDASVAPLLGVGRGLEPLEGLVRRMAQSDATVLIQGETGTGKELVARAIHAQSPRARSPFVALNCAALPDGLVESELFGHEQGAFTGASKARKGRFELASGGTLFLDEIGDISPRVQISLLRALQERRIERVGSATSVAVDVRIVAATHKNLEECVRQGSFRQDLFYRLNVLHLQVPALRDRLQDIPALIEHFQRKWGRATSTSLLGVSHEAYDTLRQYGWPGNVRELENMVQRALVVCDGHELTLDDFTFGSSAPAAAPPSSEERTGTIREQTHARDLHALRQLLLQHGGNVSRAARTLGIPRTTLMSRAKRVGLL